MEVNYSDIDSCRNAWRAIKNTTLIDAEAYFDADSPWTKFYIVTGDDTDDVKFDKLISAFKKLGLNAGKIFICTSLSGPGLTRIE